MKEYKINNDVFIVPVKIKSMHKKKQQWFCNKAHCQGNIDHACEKCIFNWRNESAFNIWIQDEDCVNNFLQGKE